MMKEPEHIINRYTFEVEVGEKDRAHRIQNQLSNIFKYQLVRVLDKVLSELTEDGITYRIEKLELDLARPPCARRGSLIPDRT